MIATLFRITTDDEGESKVVFKVPLTELSNVVKLNSFIQKKLSIKIEETE